MTRWQFSLRTLLLITAIVSAVLAVAVRIPEIVVLSAVVAAFGFFVVEGPRGMLRLLVSERHPRWSAVLWMVFGTLLLAAAVALGGRLAFGPVQSETWKICLVAALYCCLSMFCYRTALRTIRRTGSQDSPPAGR
jgi:hypothetical protein